MNEFRIKEHTPNNDLRIEIEELKKKIESLECIVSTIASKTINSKGEI